MNLTFQVWCIFFKWLKRFNKVLDIFFSSNMIQTCPKGEAAELLKFMIILHKVWIKLII